MRLTHSIWVILPLFAGVLAGQTVQLRSGTILVGALLRSRNGQSIVLGSVAALAPLGKIDL